MITDPYKAKAALNQTVASLERVTARQRREAWEAEAAVAAARNGGDDPDRVSDLANAWEHTRGTLDGLVTARAIIDAAIQEATG